LERAGTSTWLTELKSRRPKKAGVRGSAFDSSLFQPGTGKPDENVRIDPSTCKGYAGGFPKEDPFFGNGKPHMTRLQPDRTDPICHFRHDGDPYVRVAKKPLAYTSRAALATWRMDHDPRLSAALKKPDIKPEIITGADGMKYYNIWGREDLRKAATKELIQCDRLPTEALITKNDKEQLPYFVREGHSEKRPVHGHWESSDIWQIMRDEAYMDQMKIGYTPGFDDPGQRKRYYKSRLNRLKELNGLEPLSDEDAMDLPNAPSQQIHGQRRLRTSRSLPPERRHFTSCARGEIDLNGGLGTSTPRTWTSQARESWQATPRQKAVHASETSSRSMTPRSRSTPGPSSCMSPVSITNAWAAARRNSASKGSKRREATPPPSIGSTER